MSHLISDHEWEEYGALKAAAEANRVAAEAAIVAAVEAGATEVKVLPFEEDAPPSA